MHKFKTVSTLIREARTNQDISQQTLSEKLGYKSGQFLSNVERGLCSIPSKKVPLLSSILKIDQGLIISAMTEDYKRNVTIEVEAYNTQQIQTEESTNV